MKFGMLVTTLIMAVACLSQEKTQPLVYVKHMEPPLRYPPVARAAQLQGTIVVKLRIGENGEILAIETRPADGQVLGYQFLKHETEKFVKNWTFGCLNCSPDVPYEHSLKFTYLLDGEASSQDSTKVIMDLPNQVTISARPPVCDHCPPKKK